MSKKQGTMGENICERSASVIRRMNNYSGENEYAAQHIKEFSIMLCGSPRVGKSTLINALCGKEVAPTSASLDACTKEVQCYSVYNTFQRDDKQLDYKINFWDTKGLESWSETDVHSYVQSVLNKTRPICMIYCASPGSFAKLDQVKWLIQKCITEQMFCALICTNMMQNPRRNAVIEEFKKLLRPYGKERKGDHEITYFGDNKGLCTMLNSKAYVDEALEINQEPEGVHELIFGIMTSLSDDKIEGWAAAVLENRSFWTRWEHRLTGFFNENSVGIAIKDASRPIALFILDIIKSAIKK